MAKPHDVISSPAKSPQHPYLCSMNQGGNHYKLGSGHLSMSKLKNFNKGYLSLCGKLTSLAGSRGSWACRSTRKYDTETKECISNYDDCSNICRYTEFLKYREPLHLLNYLDLFVVYYNYLF